MRVMLRVDVSPEEEKNLTAAWLNDGLVTVTANGVEMILPLTYVKVV